MTRKLAMKRVKPKEIHVGRAYRMALPFLAGPSEQIAVVVSIRPATARSTQVKVEWLLPGAGLLNVYAGRVPAPCVARRAFGSALKGPPMTLKDTTAGGVEAVRAVSNNGKRWRIVPVDGDWEMQPVGHITAGQAERLCKAIEAALVASPAPTPATGVPEGWKIVPPEPTAEMIDAAFGKWRAPGWGLVRGIWKAMLASVPSPMEPGWKPDGWRWGIGTLLRKHSGAWWEGRVVGFYSTIQTPQGYNLQLDRPFGPTQIYPESALEPVPTPAGDRDG